ncbi:ABC transporter permease [Labedaea rhizosphaerae]|uniref:ABC-2 type transport system permease protein n=1 Tax=Labedaea rhizosphaerae TaxID=598644 RepID=A0A4R6SK31_LABRH|nr:ABC transporter permease [Labedaea rhizosphaerae]TDQ04458.1 ABC-2 type transport system permease protein [Labedaea rhizosphaerae]
MTNPDKDVRIGPAAAVGLVAGREINTRIRSKAFIVSTVATMVLLVAGAIVAKLLSGSGPDATIGVTQATAPLAQPVQVAAKTVGESVDTKTVDEAAGRDQVRDGDLDALLIGDGTKVRVLVKQDLDDKLRTALNVLAGQLAQNQEILSQHGDPVKVNQAVATASVDVQSIEPPHNYGGQQLVLGIIAGILIYMSLLINGQAVAQGVVEEKSSRVVELLLATVRPWQLMAGKVLGIGTLGLVQMVLIGGAGILAALGTGALTISVSAALGTVVWLVVWFLLGFFAYALVLAAAGSLVSRQEDVGGVVSPVLMFVILGYVLGVSILPGDPTNKLCEVLSILPVFSPTMMPIRLAMGGVPAWEAGLAVVLMLVAIPALVWLSGRMYRNAVMRTGARVKLKEAFTRA